MSRKIAAGAPMPTLDLSTVSGQSIRIGGSRPAWQLIVVYRGRHCPLCKTYLAKLQSLAPGFKEANAEVVAVSGDPKEKAVADVAEIKLSIPVAYGLSLDQMRALGLYISNPRSPQETDRPYAEPGLFVVNPQGQVQIVDISNAPFARPDLDGILRGIKRIQELNYPIRGTLA
jgi:peroxiredoxin